MVKIVCIADTHGQHGFLDVPEGDILIHAGDIEARSHIDIIQFNHWLGTLPHKHKVVIPGNHDFYPERYFDICKGTLTNCHFLHDDGVTAEGIKIWGSGWTPRFFDWAFMLDRDSDKLESKWAKIPVDTDVLVTHGPPHGILDDTKSSGHVGCELLIERVHVVEPKFHIFGHIHSGYGTVKKGGTTFINASVVNESYDLVNDPIIVKI